MLVSLDYVFWLGGVLIGVAFFTLFERKVLGYVHFRKGPNKVGFWGVLQPFVDAIKLFPKELWKGYSFSFFLFLGGPFFGLFLMMYLWGFVPHFFLVSSFFLGVLLFFCVLSLSIYFLLLCGWGSNSKYASFGAYRGIAQTISYEVSMIVFVLCFVYLISSFDFYDFSFFQSGWWFCFFVAPVFVGWFFVCMAESNRAPFDFSEGESELVSGFNVEFGGGVFSFIFICEYGFLILLSFLSVLIFLGGDVGFFKSFVFFFLFVWVRASFPRFRYDSLMSTAWQSFLPFSLGALFYFCF